MGLRPGSTKGSIAFEILPDVGQGSSRHSGAELRSGDARVAHASATQGGRLAFNLWFLSALCHLFRKRERGLPGIRSEAHMRSQRAANKNGRLLA